ncbi:MAG: PfkB family carbohydrate kinase [Anaerolineae bacterium]|nr:PfkB family carbohydrate kinase [Anaerolineae bacterium]
MTSVVALGAVTGGINLAAGDAEICELGFTPGDYAEVSVERMAALRLALESSRGNLPEPRSGGSVANTTDLLARAGISCGFMGVGGDDRFGRLFVSNFERAAIAFLSELESGAVTGYDFYLYSAAATRTIVLTHGANALLSPARIDSEAIKSAQLVLLDGSALDFGPESEAALLCCIQAAEERGIPFVLTLAGTKIVDSYRAFFHTFGPKAQMVAGNLAQAAVLVGLEPGASLDQVRIELAKTAIDAVVTLDADGAFARFGADEFLLPTQPIEAVDSTGAGDSFLAAFLAASMQGLAVRQALAVGNFVAGEVVKCHGARLPIDRDVPGLMQDALQFAESLDD